MHYHCQAHWLPTIYTSLYTSYSSETTLEPAFDNDKLHFQLASLAGGTMLYFGPLSVFCVMLSVWVILLWFCTLSSIHPSSIDHVFLGNCIIPLANSFERNDWVIVRINWGVLTVAKRGPFFFPWGLDIEHVQAPLSFPVIQLIDYDNATQGHCFR